MSAYLTYNTGAELVCLIIALLCISRDKNLAWRSAALYLFVVCVTEFIGIYIKTDLKQRNTWLYNILFLFEISFYTFMFQNILTKYLNSKPLIYIGLAILMISYCIELLSNGFSSRPNTSLIIQGVLLVLYSLIYFYCLIKDERYVDLRFSADFWWVAAIFIYYFAMTSLNVFYKELGRVIDKPAVVFHFIKAAANISMYTLWAYSFICRKWLTER